MTLIVDTREKADVIRPILNYYEARGIKVIRSKLYVGDYQLLENPLLVVDRKHGLQELCANVSTVPKKNRDGTWKLDENGKPQTEWKRFTAELERAQENGIKVVVLCENHNGIKSLRDVPLWLNPRLKDSPLADTGEQLARKLNQIAFKYDVDFQFCNEGQTGRRILEILTEGGNC